MYSQLSVQHPSSNGSGSPQTPFAPATFHVQFRQPELYGMFFELFCYSMGLFVAVALPPVVQHGVSLSAVLSVRVSLINLVTVAVAIGLWSVLLSMMLPKSRISQASPASIGGLVLRVTACAAVTMILISVRQPAMADLARLGLFCCTSLSLILLGRGAAAGGRELLQARTRKERSVLIVGSGWRGQRLAAELSAHRRWKYTLLGFVDPAPQDNSAPVLGGIDSLESVLMAHTVDEVLITLPVKSMYDEAQRSVAICERVGVPCRYSTDLFHTKIIKSRAIDHHDPLSVALLHMVHGDVARRLKRALDMLVAGVGLLCLSPVLLLITILIKATSEGPVLFRQKRYGLNKRLFTIYKFRTMVVHAEQQQASLEHLNENDGAAFKMKRDPRVTRIGDVLRRTSLDELPQLWNVLVGDMSLVGPRPLPMRDVSRFSEGWLMRRFSVPPGITGLWQVSGRSNLSFSNWMRLDLEYIDGWSFRLDLKILARTFPAVFKKEGAV